MRKVDLESILDIIARADVGRKGLSFSKKAGETIFEEGQTGKFMYLVQSGEVHIRIADQVVEIVGPGGVIGEMAVFDSAPRSATAMVVANCEVMAIDKSRFVALTRADPTFALHFLNLLAQRVRAANQPLLGE